jgi:hypothetical protein
MIDSNIVRFFLNTYPHMHYTVINRTHIEIHILKPWLKSWFFENSIREWSGWTGQQKGEVNLFGWKR